MDAKRRQRLHRRVYPPHEQCGVIACLLDVLACLLGCHCLSRGCRCLSQVSSPLQGVISRYCEEHGRVTPPSVPVGCRWHWTMHRRGRFTRHFRPGERTRPRGSGCRDLRCRGRSHRCHMRGLDWGGTRRLCFGCWETVGNSLSQPGCVTG